MSQICMQLSAEEKAPRPALCDLDGIDDCWMLPRLRYDGSTPITLDAIITPQTIDRDQSIVSNVQTGGIGMHLHRDGRIECIAHDGTRFGITRSDAPVRRGQTIRISGVCDGVSLRLYVDGVLQRWHHRWTGKHRMSKQPFFLGADPDAQGRPSHFFHGAMHALRLSATARDVGGFARQWQQDPFAKPDQWDALLLGKDAKGILCDTSRLQHPLERLGQEG